MSNIIDTTLNLPTYVDPFPGKDDSEATFVDCHRCGGSGNVYTNVDGGRCWECMGSKGHDSTVGAERKRAKAKITYRRSVERKLVRKQEFHNEQMAAAETAFPILAGWHEAMSEDSFLLDLWSKAFDYELSEKQVEAAAKTMQRKVDRAAQRQAEHDALSPAPAGKQRISGIVQMVTIREGNYGSVWKAIVLDHRNFKVWTTIPAGLWDQLDAERTDPDYNTSAQDFVGREVAFNATVEVSEDDDTFAFASRPTKPALTAQHEAPAPEEAAAPAAATEAPAAPAAAEGTLTHKDGTTWTLVKVLSETHYSVADSTGKVFRKRKSVFV